MFLRGVDSPMHTIIVLIYFGRPQLGLKVKKKIITFQNVDQETHSNKSKQEQSFWRVRVLL